MNGTARSLLIPAAVLVAVAAVGFAAAGMTLAQDEPPEPEWATVRLSGGPAFDLAVGDKPGDDVQVVYAAGHEPLTSTHAITWTITPGTGRLVNVAAATDGRAYAVDFEGQAYQTKNYGKQWRKIRVRDDAPVWFDAMSPDYEFDRTGFAITVGEWRLYRTNNDADSWQEVTMEADVEDQIGAAAFSPLHRTDETTFVASHRGLFKWTKDERRWTMISEPANGLPAFGEAGGPVSSQGLVIPFEYGDDPDRSWDPVLYTLFAYNSSGIYRSDDDGVNWREIPLPAGVEQVNGLAVSNGWPGDPVLMVAVASNDAVALVSLDDGLTWSKVAAKDGLVGTDVAMAVDFARVPLPDEDWRSTIRLPVVLKNDTFEPPDNIYNGSREAYVSTDGAGVLYTNDGGVTWHPSTTSFAAVRVTALDVMPGGPDAPAIAGSATAGLYSSDDAGLTWEWIDSGLPRGSDQEIFDVVVSPNFAADRTVYAFAHSGGWMSSDGGRTWSRASFPDGSTTVDFSPGFARDRTMATNGHLSTDGGATWQPMTPITGTWTAVALSSEFADDDTIWAGTSDVDSENRYGLFKSTDRGASWVIADDATLSRAQIFGLVTAKYDSSEEPRIFAATSRGLVAAFDGGIEWDRVTFSSGAIHDVESRALTQPFTTGVLLASGDGGAEFSTNRGNTFEHLPRSSKDTLGAGLTDDGHVMLVGIPTGIERLDRFPEGAD
ncbi:MAG: hypothetical protein ACK2T6_02210 [Anaerolineae bacterium]